MLILGSSSQDYYYNGCYHKLIFSDDDRSKDRNRDKYTLTKCFSHLFNLYCCIRCYLTLSLAI